MELSRAQTDDLLGALNEPEALISFLALGAGETRADWEAGQDEPMDTTGALHRLDHLRWFDEQILGPRRSRPDAPLGHSALGGASDFYCLTDSARAPRYGTIQPPLSAFLVWRTVFSFDHGAKTWSARPFLGADAGGIHDPLLRLPYSRKYDFERAQAALIRGDLLWEQLACAGDLVDVLLQRTARVAIDRHPEAPRFQMPDFEDIQSALAEDDLGIGRGFAGVFTRRIDFELVSLSSRFEPGPRRVLRTLATGGYSGPLTECRSPSSAALKLMCTRALEALQEEIHRLVHPLTHEEREDLEGTLERLADEARV